MCNYMSDFFISIYKLIRDGGSILLATKYLVTKIHLRIFISYHICLLLAVEKQLTLGHGKFFDQNLDLAYGKFGGY